MIDTINNITVKDPLLSYGGAERFPAPGMSPAHTEARRLVREGVPVFPTINKKPFLAGGFHVATTDLDQIHDWYTTSASTEVAMPTGIRTGVFVLDIDVKSGGTESLQSLEAEHAPLPETRRTKTASGGDHYFWRYPEDRIPKDGQSPKKPVIRNSASAIAPGIDIRGEGGYVLLPGSTLPDGRSYETENPETPIAEAPEWLLDAVDAAAKAKTRREIGAPIAGGTRDETLTEIAGGMRRRGCIEDEIYAAIAVINKGRCIPPLGDAQVRKIAASIAGYAVPAELATLPTTDLGNAERFRAAFGERVRFEAGDVNEWRVYEDGVWKSDSTLKVARMAQELPRLVMNAVSSLSTSDTTRPDQEANALRLESAKNQKAMMEIARALLAVPSSIFDQAPELLNVANGVVNLRTGELLPHDPELFMTQQSPVAYVPGATDPILERVLEHATGGDQTFRRYLQDASGYSATGHTGEEAFFVALGPAATSKSTFLDAIGCALGSYAATADAETFLDRKIGGGGGNAPAEDLLRILPVRFVMVGEVDPRRRFRPGRLKAATGGDSLTVRGMYARHSVEAKPRFKLWFGVNDFPEADAEDSGIWRRAHRLPFERVVPPTERKESVKRHLCDPQGGGVAVLAFIVEGAMRYLAEGLHTPDLIAKATEDLRAEFDPIAAFLESEADTSNSLATVAIGDLWARFEAWQDGEGSEFADLTKKRFGDRLEARGFKADRGAKGVRIRKGLSLLSETDTTARLARIREGKSRFERLMGDG